jgi:hypothetical protein
MDPQVFLKLVLLLVIAKLGVQLYLVYDVQGDDVCFGGGLFGGYSEVLRLGE